MTDYIRPDARLHRSGDGAYLRRLVRESGFSPEAAAARIGVGARTMRHWLADNPFPYSAQYALERLARGV